MLNREPRVVVPPESKALCRTQWMSSRESRISAHRKSLQSHQESHAAAFSRKSVMLIGDKTPEHTGRIGWLREAFPKAPIVAIVRDGRATAASLTRVPWLNANHLSAALIWTHYSRCLRNYLALQDRLFLTITFEDLVQFPEATLSSVLSHLGLDSTNVETCLQPTEEYDRQLFSEREKSWKSQAIQPISGEKLDYQKHLSARQLDELNQLLQVELREWDYPVPTPDRLSKALWYRAHLSLTKTLVQLPPSAILGELQYRASCLWSHLFSHETRVQATKGDLGVVPETKWR